MGAWWRSARARRAGRRTVAWVVAVVGVLALLAPIAASSPPAGAAAQPVDLTRPRILGAGTDLAAIASRITREPYETVFRRLVNNARGWTSQSLDDDTIGAERVKAKAAKDQAFLFAIDRTIVDGEPAPFGSPADRQAAGDAARTLLLNMYTRSRLAVPAPLGGHDRDINSSEELLQYSTAYDTLLGAGYGFTPADEAAIRTRITDLAAELYENYTVLGSAGGAATVLPNNHRSKSAAALGVAALALLDTAPAQGAPPADFRSPAAWLTFAIDQVDVVQRWTFVTPDGGYGEGPYYQRYAAQNLLPFARAWSHANHAQPWDVGGRAIPDLWTSAVYRQTQRWILDTTLPNGALAPIDDGNVDFSYYFGAAPTTATDAAAFAWRWANAPTPYDTDGSIDLSADSLVAYDDSVVPAPPSGSPTRFSAEAGTAVFRSGWDANATEAVVLGEHGAAMELGRDREGNGKIASAAHEQPDTGSFTIGAYGQKLLLDPGYLTYEQRDLVGKAPDHNLVLVNGKGPLDPFLASIQWVGDLAGLPPVDGQATISDTVDSTLLDTARVTSTYASTGVDRRFFFVDDSYLVVADALQSAPGTTPTYTWPLHGNGGGTSGGTFAPTAGGGRWTNGAGRLDAAVASDAGPVSFSTRDSNHEGPGRVLLTHTTLDASSTATGPSTHGLVVAYPSRSADAAPTVQTLFTTPLATAIRVLDPAADRAVVVLHASNGYVAIQDTKLDGTPRVLYSDTATGVGSAKGRVSTQAAGPVGLRVGSGTADVYAPRANRWFRTAKLPFTPQRADGACQVVPVADGVRVRAGWDGTVTLRAGSGNSAPAADAGPDVDNVAVGTPLRLHGRGCDVDGDTLTPRWEVVAAPPGSSWTLVAPSSWKPILGVDAAGPYQVRLTVRDGHGGVSRVSDVEVSGGPRCRGDRLTWNDPRCG